MSLNVTAIQALGNATASVLKELGLSIPVEYYLALGGGATCLFLGGKYIKRKYFPTVDPKAVLKAKINEIFGDTLGPIVYEQLKLKLVDMLSENPALNNPVFKAMLKALLNDNISDKMESIIAWLTQNKQEIQREIPEENLGDEASGEEAPVNQRLSMLLDQALEPEKRNVYELPTEILWHPSTKEAHERARELSRNTGKKIRIVQ